MTFSRFAKYWIPLLIWLGVIFLGSTDLMSAEHTSRFIAPLLHWLKPDISAAAIAQAQFFVRKCAHLIEYAILAMLLWRAVYRGTNLQTTTSILFLSVWITATLVAATDEFYQSFVPTRTASQNDVIIDIGGATLGLMICWTFTRRKSAARSPVENRKSKI
jgi:VanZ family protein